MPGRAKLTRIIASDYAALLCVIGPVVALGLWVGVDVLGLGKAGKREGFTFLAGMAAVVSAVCLPALVVRVRGIQAVFRDGVEVEGQVTSLQMMGDRGTIEYAFELDGREHRVSRAIAKSARTERLAVGTPVTVVVDPKDPSRAFLKFLFT